MADNASSSADSKRWNPGLTLFEKQVLGLFLGGRSSAEIETQVGLHEKDLRRHIHRICDKLHVANDLELILFALHHHLIDPYDGPLS